MIRVLLFDFYGVFLPDAYSAWLRANNLTRTGVYAELIQQRDTGAISEDDFLKGLSEALGRQVVMDEIHQKENTPDIELIDLVRKLKTEYKIYLFSNASARLRDKLEDWAINDLFDEVIISGEIGYAKPSDEAFAIATERTGSPSGDILFIDDNPDNVTAAVNNGISACLYSSLDDLHEALHFIGWQDEPKENL